MHLLSKIHVAGAMCKVFAKILNINMHNPGLFNCHNKRFVLLANRCINRNKETLQNITTIEQ